MDGYLPYPGRIRILHVDDEPVDLEITGRFLKREGNGCFEISSVLSAEEALAKLGRCHFDAIISDYNMPCMDGLEFLEEVRKKVVGIPFILFSGMAEPEIVEEAVKKGADRYITKRGNPTGQCIELARAIRDLVKEREEKEMAMMYVNMRNQAKMEGKEKTWAWPMPSGRIYKVVTNTEDGTIKVYDENRKLVGRDEELSKELVSFIEETFFEIVAAELGEKGVEKAKGTEDNLEIAMYIR